MATVERHQVSQIERKCINLLDAERSILRWGGLAGMLGSVILIMTFVFVGVFVGDASTAAVWRLLA